MSRPLPTTRAGWRTAAGHDLAADDDDAEVGAVDELLEQDGGVLLARDVTGAGQGLGVADADGHTRPCSPSAGFTTIGIADSCPTVDEAVLQAGLARALVETAEVELRAGSPVSTVRREIVQGASWRAARYGLDDGLVDVVRGDVAPAGEVVRGLLDHVRPALEASGDWDEVSVLADRAVRDGGPAARQRRAFARRSSLADVVDLLVAETAGA